MNNAFLFSVDLEDIRFLMEDGLGRPERVPANVHGYLEWLKSHGFRCTFFVVGDVAEAYPSLIREIIEKGHEIACHGYRHIPLDQQTPDQFRNLLEANRNALTRAGAKNIQGFRAPIFSLTEKTAWAYEVLKDLGFTYSSSVLPAKNPFYGWPEFGPRPKMIDGILEIPMTVRRFGPYRIPTAGGVYFRVLPAFFIRRSIKKIFRSNRPLAGYFHPYDIDTEQERFMHPEINDSRFYNYLMYYNRKNVFRRLDAIVKRGFTICPYAEYVRREMQGLAKEEPGGNNL
ncbi:MAG: polysaccharide deacetylase family protein [Candidatus Aminicenantes bacterium]|nr:polysaccharide deacetylase family protein [Candidatus Aminicenantes bacterium]